MLDNRTGKNHKTSSEPNGGPSFAFSIDGNTRTLTYQQAFAVGHKLVKERKYAVADAVFTKLTEVTDRGPRAHIMLAICKAGQSDYKASRAVLDSVFHDEDSVLLASALHDIIVNARMGFKDDAVEELVQLVNEHKELPTLCLWLGDMLEASQRVEKAKQCFKLAIKRDRRGGGVALAAHQQLRRFES